MGRVGYPGHSVIPEAKSPLRHAVLILNCTRRRTIECLPRSRIGTEAIVMTAVTDSKFDITAFLSSAGLGRRLVHLSAKEAFFSQGNPADCVYYRSEERRVGKEGGAR